MWFYAVFPNCLRVACENVAMFFVYEHLVYFILSPKYRSRVTGAHTVQKFAKKWMAQI
jgi:hypothetical protein